MRNRCKTLLRDHSVPEVILQACPKHIQSQPYLRPSPLKDLKDLPIHTEYLVELFKYPGTGNHILMDTADGYGMTPMIGLYGLVSPYSIARITTTQSRVVGKDRKKKSKSKCYCSVCDYVVQSHPSINNHIHTHLCLSLLCTINGCFTIEHGCADMWNHVTKEHENPQDLWEYHPERSPRVRNECCPLNARGVRFLSPAHQVSRTYSAGVSF